MKSSKSYSNINTRKVVSPVPGGARIFIRDIQENEGSCEQISPLVFHLLCREKILPRAVSPDTLIPNNFHRRAGLSLSPCQAKLNVRAITRGRGTQRKDVRNSIATPVSPGIANSVASVASTLTGSRGGTRLEIQARVIHVKNDSPARGCSHFPATSSIFAYSRRTWLLLANG